MIDLNHGSGCQYDAVSRANGIGAAVNAAIDAALLAHHRLQPPRRYVSTSGLGRECLRQIQYDYLAVPKDDGREFEPSTLRIFEAGHRGEISSPAALSSPSRSTPRKWPSTRPISICPTRRCSLRSTVTPGSSLASWCRSIRRWRSG